MIRPLRPQDMDQVMALWLQGNLSAHPFVPPAFWRDNAPAVREALLQAQVSVYDAGGAILGFVGMQGDYLAGIFVDRAAQSRGIGRALLDHVKGVQPAFFLHVYQDNGRAVAFYRREGLAVTQEGVDQDTGKADFTMVWRARPAEGIQPVKLRERPALLEGAARWFHQAWKVPLKAYRESMAACLAQREAVPQWYLAINAQDEILAGAGVIANDFHNRTDLTPNLCALYVDPAFRRRGLARQLLDLARQDMAGLGIGRLYLVTHHTEFYEGCGWHFLTMAKEADGRPIRLYQADPPPQ